jgi:hypothetical protein
VTVLGSGTTELVFAPARPGPEATREIVFEMRRQPDGQLVLPVFSSLPRLVETLGEYQPWVCVPVGNVRDAVRRHHVAQLALDPALDGAAWRWGEAALTEFDEHLSEQSGEHMDETTEGRR